MTWCPNPPSTMTSTNTCVERRLPYDDMEKKGILPERSVVMKRKMANVIEKCTCVIGYDLFVFSYCCVCTLLQIVLVYLSVCMHACVCITLGHMHAHTYARMCAHTNTHTHTHTLCVPASIIFCLNITGFSLSFSFTGIHF